jgi:hypothetical protein
MENQSPRLGYRGRSSTQTIGWTRGDLEHEEVEVLSWQAKVLTVNTTQVI